MLRAWETAVGAGLVLVLGLARADSTWVRFYDGPAHRDDEAHFIVYDDSGDAYVGGFTSLGSNDQDFLLIKYRPDGDTAWLRRFHGTPNRDEPKAMVRDHAGNVILTGFFNGVSGSYGDWLTVKYLPNGDSLWAISESYSGQDYANALCVDDSDNVIVVGRFGSPLYSDFGVVKYTPDGAIPWVRTYDGGDVDEPVAVVAGHDGCAYVGGWSFQNDSFYPLTVKYSPQGDTVWTRLGPAPGHIYAMAMDSSGDICVAGDRIHPSQPHDYLVIKYNPDGDTLWMRTYDGPGHGDDYAMAITTDPAGNCYVTGFSGGVGTDVDYATIKYSPAGESLWVARYDGPQHSTDQPRAIAVDGPGNVYVTGTSVGSGTGWDAATVEYDPSGNQLWAARYDRPAPYEDAYGLAIAPDGNAGIAGRTSTDSTGSDWLVIKYGPNGAVEERQTPHASRLTPEATIVHGALKLDRSWVKGHGSCALLDAAGRRVADLHAGVNDVSGVAPGVYFVRQAPGAGDEASRVTKVVVTR